MKYSPLVSGNGRRKGAESTPPKHQANSFTPWWRAATNFALGFGFYICSGITKSVAQVPFVVAADPSATPTIARVQEKHDERKEKLWYASRAFEAGDAAFAAPSAWRKQETNPLLAANGVTSRSIGIKLGLAAATLVLRKNKELRSGLTLSGLRKGLGGVASHNPSRTNSESSRLLSAD